MKLATTTEDFGRFLKTHQEKIDSVCEAGFKYIDLSMYVVGKNDELLLSDDWYDNAKTILNNTQKKVQNLFRLIPHVEILFGIISL